MSLATILLSVIGFAIGKAGRALGATQADLDAKKGPISFDNKPLDINDGDHILGISSDYIYIMYIMVSLLVFITTLSTICRCVQNIEQKKEEKDSQL